MATRRIYLVRHGEYDWDDQPGPLKGLTPRGVKQARLTANLRKWPSTPTVECGSCLITM